MSIFVSSLYLDLLLFDSVVVNSKVSVQVVSRTNNDIWIVLGKRNLGYCLARLREEVSYGDAFALVPIPYDDSGFLAA